MPNVFTQQFLRVGQSTSSFAMDRKESTYDTLALAHFLASTGPEQFLKPSTSTKKQQQPRFMDRLSRPQPPQRKPPAAIPLPVAIPSHHTFRDSGVYNPSMHTQSIHAKSQPQLKLRSSPTKEPFVLGEDKDACRHCRQPYDRQRRLSCPSFLPTGKLLCPERTTGDLRAMIEALKAQLAQEQASRLQLEKAYSLLNH